MLLSGLVWACYFLTQIIMVIRHAGQVCSGFYLPHPHIFREPVDSLYVKDNGLFLWYGLIAQAGFALVMFTGVVSMVN